MRDTILLDILRDTIREAVPRHAEVALAYSGGLDSSILAALVREVARPRCYTCVVPESHDARMAPAQASEQGLTTDLLVLSPEDLISHVRTVSWMLNTTNPSQVAYTIPMVCVIERSQESTVLGGHGADEAFGGYAKYKGLANPSKMMSEDLDKMRQEARMLQEAFPNRTLVFPFADSRVVEFARRLSEDDLVRGHVRKIVLRDLAVLLGLPCHSRPKKAAQYSSGTLRMMRHLARRDGLRLKEWTKAVATERRPTP